MKPPRFLSDLYADLRDRKLLPLVVVLILAMVAVPFILKNETATPPPASPAGAAEVPDGAPSAAVMVSDPGLRDYRERLDQLRSKNPFAGEPTKPPDLSESAIQDVSVDSGGTTPPVTSSGTGGSGSFTETFSETVSESTATDTTTEEVTINEGDGSGDSGSGSEPSGESQWYTFNVDVRTGPAGDLRERNNLQDLTVLPSRSNPVAVFFGVDGGKEAVFMISPDVVDSRGDGSCLPTPASCQFLSLRKSEERRFQYAPHGEPETFVLAVDEIRFERVKDPREANRAARSADADDARAGLEAFVGL